MTRSVLGLSACGILASSFWLVGAESTVSEMGEVDLHRFDHGEHGKALEREGLACVACHAVGAPAEAPDDEQALKPPDAACHFCHVDSTRQVRAPSRCETCHADVGRPDSHGVGWLDEHGSASRLGACSDCHRSGFCVDCHERRESVRYQVHDRTFLSVHGIEVRVDPSSCGTCHAESFCVSCHSSQGVRP